MLVLMVPTVARAQVAEGDQQARNERQGLALKTFGVGMETFNDPNVYFSLEGGLRVRLSQSSARSFWVSALAETSAAYFRSGVKMGYSF